MRPDLLLAQTHVAGSKGAHHSSHLVRHVLHFSSSYISQIFVFSISSFPPFSSDGFMSVCVYSDSISGAVAPSPALRRQTALPITTTHRGGQDQKRR